MIEICGQQFRGVVSDLDGTLLTSDHMLPPGAERLFAELAAGGTWVALASARPPRSVTLLSDELGLKGENVALNGALALNWDRHVVIDMPIVPSTAIEILLACEMYHDVELSVYSGWRWLASACFPGIAKEAAIVGFTPEIVDPRMECENIPVHKILLIAKSEIPTDLQRVLIANDGLEVSRSNERYLEITAAGVSKMHAVGIIAANAGLSMSDLIVFGDGDNDAELLEAAGLGVAVGCASSMAKQASDIVIGTSDEGAVTEFLECHMTTTRYQSPRCR